jgi:hypothetical protein
MEVLCPNRGRDLDEEYLIQNYLGKTRQQVVDMLCIDPLRSHFFINDISFMSEAGFCYYFPAVLSYLDLLRDNNEAEYFEIALSDVLRALRVVATNPSRLRNPLVRSQVMIFLDRYDSALMTDSDEGLSGKSASKIISELRDLMG